MTPASSAASTRDPNSAWPALVVWLVVCFTAPALGSWAGPDAWYAQLRKPAWNPPPWVFGPVWTALYVTMAVAAWTVWRRGGFKAQRLALSLFLTQLGFNALWTPLFFGLHEPGAAFADIVLLWLTLVATIAMFWRVHRGAALLLGPYLAWVSFAAFLNFTIWQLNS